MKNERMKLLIPYSYNSRKPFKEDHNNVRMRKTRLVNENVTEYACIELH